MRTLKLTAGAVVVACALAATFAAPSFAAEKTPMAFGKFHAKIVGQTISPSNPGLTKGTFYIGELKIGPYTFTGEKKYNGDGELQYGPACTKTVKSKGEVTEEVSETFEQDLFFKNCIGYRKLGGGLEEQVIASFTLGIVFHSNGSAELTEPSVTIHGESLVVKAKKSYCVVEVPEQTVPLQAEAHPEKEYEAATYSNEEETLEGGKAKRYEGGVEKKLDIETLFKKIEADVKTSPQCPYIREGKGEGDEGLYNKETGEVEYKTGILEGEIEEITLKKGSVWFEPAGG